MGVTPFSFFTSAKLKIHCAAQELEYIPPTEYLLNQSVNLSSEISGLRIWKLSHEMNLKILYLVLLD